MKNIYNVKWLLLINKMTEELLADYLVQDGSAIKHPLLIAVQLGSFK